MRWRTVFASISVWAISSETAAYLEIDFRVRLPIWLRAAPAITKLFWIE
jgi:hypothetical protein